jgi:hypothetical protein
VRCSAVEATIAITASDIVITSANTDVPTKHLFSYPDATTPLGFAMKVPPRFRGSLKGPAITEVEFRALRDVADGAVVQPLTCRRLNTLGLIEQKRGGWALTNQGEIALMFRKAR